MTVRNKSLKLFILLIIAYSTAINSLAQSIIEFDSLANPKIGLVLSGGGAKGFAHIGVLKVLEEKGIKPDYITGTSMGALVAALYSLGYTPQQMEELVTNFNWGDLFSNKISLRNVPIFYKSNYPNYPLHLEIYKRGQLSLPSGMIEGHKIQALFSKLAWSSFQYKNYDSFPIPFRCIATDLITAKPYVFNNGNLAEAMRASMSIPTVFSPIEKDSLLLIDGGAVRNFPVQDCKNLGADLIIGVYAGLKDSPKKEDLKSMLSILTQSSMFYGVQQSKEQAKLVNLLIKPDFSDYSTKDFNKSQKIIDVGELAARDSLVLESLHKISDLVNKNKVIAPVKVNDSIEINNIKVIGCKYCDTKTIIKTSKLKAPNKLTAIDIDKAIARIYSTMQFDKISYDIKANSLLLYVKEHNRANLNLGLHYDDSYGASALINTNIKHVFLKGSDFSGKFAISANPRVNLSYKYYPTNRRRLEFSLNTYMQLNKIPDIVKEANESYQRGHYVHSLIDIKTQASWSPFRNFMLHSSIGWQLNSISLKEGMELFYDTNTVNHFSNYYEFGLLINSLNDRFFPGKGTFLSIKVKQKYNTNTSNVSTSKFEKDLADKNLILTFDFKQHFLIAKRFSIIPELTFGVMEHKDFITQKFFLGGQTYNRRPNSYNFGGLKANYLATDNFLIVGIGGQLRLFKNLYIQFGAEQLFFANHTDIDSETDPEFIDYTFGNWNFGLGYKSKFGPLRLNVSKSPERKNFVYSVNIGIPF